MWGDEIIISSSILIQLSSYKPTEGRKEGMKEGRDNGRKEALTVVDWRENTYWFSNPNDDR